MNQGIDIKTAFALVHQSAIDMPRAYKDAVRTNALWRVKNWREGRKGHPIDPGWDDGVYCICHKKFRTVKRERGEMVVDCVDDGRAESEGYAVRSYFVIEDWNTCRFSETIRKDLLFSYYFFCDGETPIRVPRPELPAKQWQYYLGIPLSQEQIYALKASPSYASYSVSDVRGPASIDERDWLVMLEAKRVAIAERERRLRER